MVELPYGRVPYPLDPGPRARVLAAPELPPPPDLATVIDAALAAPIDSPPLATRVRPGDRVTVIVSDATRSEPRRHFLAAIARQLPTVQWTIAIATGTHGPSPLAPLDLPMNLLRGATLVNHDGHAPDELVDLGATPHGTRMCVHRAVLDADLVVATGCIVPHYFAGYGAGAKAIFPGLGAAAAIRHNHRLKQAPGARAGLVDGNPCREDLEAAVALLPTPIFLLNGVIAPDGVVHAAVAGDLRTAFRAGARLAESWYRVCAPRSGLIVASDALPVTASLYQAAKIAAAAAPLVDDGGTLAIVAECPDGIGPLDVVNDAIFRIGVLPRLPPGASLVLVSGLPADEVRATLLRPAASAQALLDAYPGDALIIPRASKLLLTPT